MAILEFDNIKVRITELTRADNFKVAAGVRNLDFDKDDELRILGHIDDIITVNAIKAVWVKDGDKWQQVDDGKTVKVPHGDDTIDVRYPMTATVLNNLPASIATPLVNTATEVNTYVRDLLFLAPQDTTTTQK